MSKRNDPVDIILDLMKWGIIIAVGFILIKAILSALT